MVLDSFKNFHPYYFDDSWTLADEHDEMLAWLEYKEYCSHNMSGKNAK